MSSKIVVLALIVLGEVALIAAEVLGAKMFREANQPFWSTFLKLLLPITLGAWILLVGYMFGLKAFSNIWVLSVVSVTSIIISEPFIVYAITKEGPTPGALVGFILGTVGLIIALVW
jgi:hypothetical protein